MTLLSPNRGLGPWWKKALEAPDGKGREMGTEARATLALTCFCLVHLGLQAALLTESLGWEVGVAVEDGTCWLLCGLHFPDCSGLAAAAPLIVSDSGALAGSHQAPLPGISGKRY